MVVLLPNSHLVVTMWDIVSLFFYLLLRAGITTQQLVFPSSYNTSKKQSGMRSWQELQRKQLYIFWALYMFIPCPEDPTIPTRNRLWSCFRQT